MAGLSTFQSGSKGSKMVNLDVLTIWDNFGPIWTLLGLFRQKSSCCPIRTKSGFTEVLLSKTSFFCLKWFKRVQTGPKKVPNGQKQFGWPFQTLLDSFGPLWNVDKPAMFGPFCLSYWCVFFGTPCSLVYPLWAAILNLSVYRLTSGNFQTNVAIL